MSKLAIAGRELMKGNIGNAIQAIAHKSTTSELIRPAQHRHGNFFFGINGADKLFVWGNYNSSLTAYQKCPVVSSVIHRMAQATVNGKQFIMNDQGKESQKAEAKALRKLLKRPNGMQSGMQFRAQGNVYKRIYGYCPILIVKPVGFETDFSLWKMWNIPPWMIQTEDNPYYFLYPNQKPFLSVRLTYMGQSVNLDADSIFFLKENQISTTMFEGTGSLTSVSMFLPDSKLSLLESPINNFMASLESRGSLIRERGPQWILTNDSNDSGDAGLFPIPEGQKELVQEDFRQYGIMGGQRKAIITDAKLKLQEVGFDVDQLKLLEGEVQDAKDICDGLNFPPYLLGLIDAKFDNQQIAERAFYTNSIIPDSESDDEQWTERLGLDALGLTLVTDFTHLAPLQENITEKGKGRWYMNQALQIEWENDLITWNRWRELLGEDTVTGRDMYYTEMINAGLLTPKQSTPNTSNVSTDSQSSNNSNNSNGNSN